MAEKKATLVLELKDLATKGLKSFGGVLESLTSSVLGVSLSLASLVALAVESITAFSEQEQAVSRLAVALRNQGDSSAKTREDLVAYAGQLQKVTAFSDDTLIENQALLVSFGLMGDQLKGGLSAAMDLATARHIDLSTASMLVGKAFQGNVETLKRYGIEIDGNLPASERFAAVLQALNSNFGGSAAADANTYAGRLTILKNQFSELKETIGRELMPVANEWLRWTSKALDKTLELTDAGGPDLRGRQLTIAALEKQSNQVALSMASMERFNQTDNAVYKERMARLASIEKALVRERALLAGETAAGRGPGPAPKAPIDDEGIKLAAQTRQRLEIQSAGEVERIGIEAEFLAQRLEAHNQFELAKEVRSQAVYETLAAQRAAEAEDEKKKLDARKAAMTSTLTYLSTLQQSKNKEMVAVGRTAASAQATIDTYAAATAAYRALSGIPVVGPILGAAAAASIMTAGLANVARINAVQMAEGGVVMPRAGGTLANVGEAGQAEAIIPLGDKRAQQMLGGGGGASIVIQAGTIVADPMSVREFAQRIDDELFRLQRNRKSGL